MDYEWELCVGLVAANDQARKPGKGEKLRGSRWMTYGGMLIAVRGGRYLHGSALMVRLTDKCEAGIYLDPIHFGSEDIRWILTGTGGCNLRPSFLYCQIRYDEIMTIDYQDISYITAFK